MKRLRDYSGGFDPNIKCEDFSKDTLIELLKLYSRLFITLDGFWYLSVKERISNEKAIACDTWVWERLNNYEIDNITKLLKIHENDVVDFMKVLQTRPLNFVLKSEMEVINRNDVVLTVSHCPTLEALEKEGEGRDETFCKLTCSIMRKKHAELFNPDIKVKCLKLPPRKSKEEICCQWEYKRG